VAAGIAAGFVVVGGIAFAVLRLSVRLPLKPLFAVTGAMMLILAIGFVGNGIRNLQEAGWVSVTRLDGVPSGLIPALLGLWPTQQTVLAQLIVLCLLLTFFLIAKLRSRSRACTALLLKRICCTHGAKSISKRRRR
jgi:high-affinity iron transporter